jgi:hypothetical protein
VPLPVPLVAGRMADDATQEPDREGAPLRPPEGDLAPRRVRGES